MFSATQASEGIRLKDRFTVVESTNSGWCYSALLRDDRLVVVLMTDADLLPRENRWDHLLAQAPETLKRITQHGGELQSPPRIHHAAGSRLENAYGPGWIAAGDAALAFDPLSSYGVTSAMGSAYYAAHAASDFLAGKEKALPAYQAVLDLTWQNYIVQHRESYAVETRWSESTFWLRRSHC